MKFAYLILALIFANALAAQERPKAVLVDEHGMLPCEHNLSLIDTWYAELSKHPDSTGLAVIASPPAENIWAFSESE